MPDYLQPNHGKEVTDLTGYMEKALQAIPTHIPFIGGDTLVKGEKDHPGR